MQKKTPTTKPAKDTQNDSDNDAADTGKAGWLPPLKRMRFTLFAVIAVLLYWLVRG